MAKSSIRSPRAIRLDPPVQSQSDCQIKAADSGVPVLPSLNTREPNPVLH